MVPTRHPEVDRHHHELFRACLICYTHSLVLHAWSKIFKNYSGLFQSISSRCRPLQTQALSVSRHVEWMGIGPVFLWVVLFEFPQIAKQNTAYLCIFGKNKYMNGRSLTFPVFSCLPAGLLAYVLLCAVGCSNKNTNNEDHMPRHSSRRVLLSSSACFCRSSSFCAL